MSVPKKSMIPRRKYTQIELEKLAEILSTVDVKGNYSLVEQRVFEALTSDPVTKKMVEQRGFRSLMNQLRDDGGGKRPRRKNLARPGRGITHFSARIGITKVGFIRRALGRLHEKLT